MVFDTPQEHCEYRCKAMEHDDALVAFMQREWQEPTLAEGADCIVRTLTRRHTDTETHGRPPSPLSALYLESLSIVSLLLPFAMVMLAVVPVIGTHRE